MDIQLEHDADIEVLGEEATGMVAQAHQIAIINDVDGEARAAEMLKKVKTMYKTIENKRLELTRPLNEGLRNVNAMFKAYSAPLEEAERIIKAGMTKFRQQAEFQAKELLRLKAENEARQAIATAQDTLDPEAIKKAQEAELALKTANDAAPRTVNTESGQVRYRKVWKFEIIDAEQLPRAYLMPDEKKIKDTINLGMPIAGVRSWVESVPSSY